MTPAAPLVGAVTTRLKAAFSSLTARAKQLTQPRTSRKACLPACRMAAIQSSTAGIGPSPVPSRLRFIPAARRTTFRPPGKIPSM